MNAGANCIAEASFKYDDLFCAVDLLKKDNAGYSIYEVKSSLDIEEHQLADVAFQKYVLEKCGLKINHIYILYPNREYIFNKKLDLNEYFIAECVDDNVDVFENLENMDNSINDIRKLLKSSEPLTIFNNKCKECAFREHCLKGLPMDNVSILNGIVFYKYFNKGIITVEDYVNRKEYKKSKNKMRKLQVESILNKATSPLIDKDSLKEFIDNIKYPLYHLDFKTTSLIIPKVDGFRPGESYPFQYSLHIEYDDGTLEHKEFLGDELNPTRALAEQLIRDIPEDTQLIAYHASTEINVVKYLAKKYPDLSKELLNLANNFIDLLDAFKMGYYYDPKQGSSNSIKIVMLALCPHMEDAYYNLPVIHNGEEAKAEYIKLLEVKGKD